jgi:UDP-N-acetylglucosamine--N-acetylmuramyl-(pentapeptide) pyrophosphoryl-undecaprenol N-acetylglucosamine transferase
MSDQPAFNIVFTGGGTGGHIYPCLAVAEYINLNYPDCKLFYTGNSGSLEDSLLKRVDHVDFLPYQAPKMPSFKNPLAILSFLSKFNIAVQQTLKYFRENNISLVFGTGGYAAAPTFVAAQIAKTPFMIHNLDNNLGLVNKISKIAAKKVSLGFPVKKYLNNEKFTFTGNPANKNFCLQYYRTLIAQGEINEMPAGYELSSEEKSVGISKKDNEFCILVTGGSQGSKFINDMVGSVLPGLAELELKLQDSGKTLKIIHITGKDLFQEHINYYTGLDNQAPTNYLVEPYTYEMQKFCNIADVAICRSGAMTCAEMAMSLTVPIFIPLPWAANNHQFKNAEALVDANCAYMIQQNEADLKVRKENLLSLISSLATDDSKLSQMKENLKKFAKPAATQDISETLVGLV